MSDKRIREARGALCAISAAAENAGREHWSEPVPIYPTDATPATYEASIVCAVLAGVDCLAHVGLEEDIEITPWALDRVLPLLRIVDGLATHFIENVWEDKPLGPGESPLVELFCAVQYAARIGLAMWAPSPAREVAA